MRRVLILSVYFERAALDPNSFIRTDSDSSDILDGTHSLASSTPRRLTTPTSTVNLSETLLDLGQSRKRKTSALSDRSAPDTISSTELRLETDDLDLAEVSENQHEVSSFLHVQPPHLVYPKSLYSTPVSPLLVGNEETSVLKEVLVRYEFFILTLRLM